MTEKREGDPLVQLRLDSVLNEPPQPPIAKAPKPVTVKIIRRGDPDYEEPLEAMGYKSLGNKRK